MSRGSSFHAARMTAMGALGEMMRPKSQPSASGDDWLRARAKQSRLAQELTSDPLLLGRGHFLGRGIGLGRGGAPRC